MAVSWIALLAALLLIVGPLVVAIVLAVRGRPAVGAVLGGGGLIAILLIGALFSVRPVHHGEPERHVALERTRFANDDIHVRRDGMYVLEDGEDVLIAPGRGGLGENHTVYGPDGPVTSTAPGSVRLQVGPGDSWRDAARRHEEELHRRQRRDRELRPVPVPHTPAVASELVSEDELPEWVQTPPANRLVVTGPLVTDEDGGPAAARRVAEEATTDRLIEEAGLPPGATINPDDVPRPGRVAVQTLTRTTGENVFTMYRAFVQVDASADVLDRLRQGHRNRLGQQRALWAVGGAGACVVCFAGLWGLGRRKLRAPGPAAGERGEA